MRPDDAVDKPELRPWRGTDAALAGLRRGLLSRRQRQQRQQQRRGHGLHDLDGPRRQRRDVNEHELRRAGFGDELERREERAEEEAMRRLKERREKREKKREEERREKSSTRTHTSVPPRSY